MKRLVIDTANLVFRIGAVYNTKYSSDHSPEDNIGLAMHMVLNSIRKVYNAHKPDEIAITFEGRSNWRKKYTASEECVSKRGYKANRVKDDSMIAIYELMNGFEELVKHHTNFVCLSHPNLEGDDLFAGYVRKYTELGDEVIGLSGDRDFVQLWKYPNFTLINPEDGNPRTVESVCKDTDDPIYFMFEKAIRGDSGDNVMSAFPRVRKTRIKLAMENEYELAKLMNETWSFTDPDTQASTEYRVGDLFKENMLLMNLEQQPEDIRQLIVDTIDNAERGKWSFFHFSRFCGKFNLKQIGEQSALYVPMFSLTGKEKVDPKNALLTF